MERIRRILKNNAAYILFFAGYTAAFLLFVRTLGYTLPFVLGLLLGILTRPACRFLERRLHLRRNHAALVTTILSYTLFLAGAVLLLYWLCHELIQFVAEGSYFQYEALSTPVRTLIEQIAEKLPELTGKLTDMLSGSLPTLLPSAGNVLKLFLSVPALFLILALIPITAFLTLLYREKLRSLAASFLGPERLLRLRHAMRRHAHNSNGFVFSYFLIYLITFCESVILLHLLQMSYPMITALIVTVSDIFPVLGPGAVLLPLCLYRLLCGSYAQAIGLFAGWIILTVVRQVIEPRLVSKVTRTPAFAMLAAVYASLISGNFWIIPYTALLFFSAQLLRDAKILSGSSKNKSGAS